MKLNYRGVNYDCEPSAIDMMESEVGGLYRGQPWKLAYPRHIPVAESIVELNYRRVHFCTGETAPATAATTRVLPASIFAARPNILSEVAKVHRANICQNLQRRFQAARSKGDKNLIQMLENEWKQLICSI